MTTPRDDSDRPGLLGRFTPDGRRWRRRIAGLAAVGAPLAFYGAYAVASGVSSGFLYNLLAFALGVLAMVLPAIGVAALLAPDSAAAHTRTSEGEESVATLKRRYAAGEIDRSEFDRRLDALMGSTADVSRRRRRQPDDDRSTTDEELERSRR